MKLKKKTKEENQKIGILIQQSSKTTKKIKGLISFYEKLLSSKSDSKIVLLRPNLRHSLGIVEKPNVTELCASLAHFKIGNAIDFTAFVLKNVMVHRQVGPDGLLTKRSLSTVDIPENKLSQPRQEYDEVVRVVKDEVLVFAQAPIL